MNRTHKYIFIISAFLLPSLMASCSDDPETVKFKEEIKQFRQAQSTFLEANKYINKITSGDSAIGTISEDQRKKYLSILENSLNHAKSVSKKTLSKLHPKLPNAYNSIFIPCLENEINGIKTFDYKASVQSQILNDKWIDWWNSHYKEFKNV